MGVLKRKPFINCVMWERLEKSVKKRLPNPIKPSTTRLFETGLRWCTVLPLAQVASLRGTCSVDVQNVHPSYGIWSIKHFHIANWYSIFVCCSPNCKKKNRCFSTQWLQLKKEHLMNFPSGELFKHGQIPTFDAVSTGYRSNGACSLLLVYYV